MLLEIIATLAAGLFAGAAIYIDLAEQPARKQVDIAAALKEWRPSYKRAAVVQAFLAAAWVLWSGAGRVVGGGERGGGGWGDPRHVAPLHFHTQPKPKAHKEPNPPPAMPAPQQPSCS